MKVPERMLAAVLVGPDRLEVKEVDTPQPGFAEVLIRVEACALCGSDVSLLHEPWDGQPPPSRLWPCTLWGKLYLGWFVLCFLMVWIGTWAVNRPVPVFGLPLVYVWCSGWGLLWLCGCLFCGLRIERDRGREE